MIKKRNDVLQGLKDQLKNERHRTRALEETIASLLSERDAAQAHSEKLETEKEQHALCEETFRKM